MKQIDNSSGITFLDDLNATTKYTLIKDSNHTGECPYNIFIIIEGGKENITKTFGIYANKDEWNDAFEALKTKFKEAMTVDKSFWTKE